jgi:ribonuclease R
LQIPLNKPRLKNAILTVFYDNPEKTFNYKQISSLLEIKDPEDRKLVYVALEELVESGNLESSQRGKFQLKSRGGFISGRVEMQPQGFAYVISEEADQPVLVSLRNLNHAMEGDKVKVALYARRKKHQPEGEVVEIEERAKSTFVWHSFTFDVICFFIPTGKSGSTFYSERQAEWRRRRTKSHCPHHRMAGPCQKPVWRNHRSAWQRRRKRNRDARHPAEFDLPIRFPENVLKAAKKTDEIPEEEIANRRDICAV